MSPTVWDELPGPVRAAVRRNTGEVLEATPASSGRAPISFALTTESGRLFLKGVEDDRRARIEVRAQPDLPGLSPRLHWHDQAAGYLLMAFDFIAGAHADLSPGSPDLEQITETLSKLSEVRQPGLPVLPASKRWASFADGDLAALDGDTPVHTDLTAENILIVDRAWTIDWAWPTLGAPWLDTADMVMRLIHAGHTPDRADEWADGVTAWRKAPRESVANYALMRSKQADIRGFEVAGSWRKFLAYLFR